VIHALGTTNSSSGRHALNVRRHSAECPGGIPVATWVPEPPLLPAGRHRAGLLVRAARVLIRTLVGEP
jgi:hypothetical protein